MLSRKSGARIESSCLVVSIGPELHRALVHRLGRLATSSPTRPHA